MAAVDFSFLTIDALSRSLIEISVLKGYGRSNLILMEYFFSGNFLPLFIGCGVAFLSHVARRLSEYSQHCEDKQKYKNPHRQTINDC